MEKKRSVNILEIIRLYTEELKSAAQIGKIFNVSDGSILNWLKKEGIPIRGAGLQKIYKLNDHYFEKINTPARAYFLGLMYTDGTVGFKYHDISLGFSGEEDAKILEKFNEEMESTYLITERKIQAEKFINPKKHYRISLSSKKMKEDLIKLGCTPRKSLILKFPTEEQVPSYLIHHFLRGVFEGDGSISYKKDGQFHFSIISSTLFIEKLIPILNGILGISLTPRNDKGQSDQTAYISAGGIVSAKKLYDYLYKDCGKFHFTRKKRVFEEGFVKYLSNINARLFSQTDEKQKEICDLFGLIWKKEMKSKLSDEQQIEIIEYYKEVQNLQEVKRKFDCSRSMVKNILKTHGIPKFLIGKDGLVYRKSEKELDENGWPK